MTPTHPPAQATRAMVIAFCDSTPHNPLPRPYVVAQASAEAGKHELWNMPIAPEMPHPEVFAAFATAYLHQPSERLRMSFLCLTRFRKDACEFRVFVASRLLFWQDFLRLDDKELIPLTRARKQPSWTDATRMAIDNAYRSEGMKLILGRARLVRQSRIGSLQAHA